MSTTSCFLCSNTVDELTGPAASDARDYDMSAYQCRRCGPLLIGESLGEELRNDSERAFRLACLVLEYRLRGDKGLWGIFDNDAEIGSLVVGKHLSRAWRVDELLSEFPKPTQIIDRTLLNLSHLVQHPMDSITVMEADAAFLSFCPKRSLRRTFYYLKNYGLVEDISSTCNEDVLAITPAGWGRIQELLSTSRESKQAFVAMWFDPCMETIYEGGIRPSIEEAGYDCRIINNVEHNNKICDEIVAEIRKSRFVIADFTGQRGGVYFEAGYAMGMGLPVIWLVHKDDVDKLHFDTRQYNHIVYESAEDLKPKLYSRIAATIQ